MHQCPGSGGHCEDISLGPLALIYHAFRPLQVLSACTSALAHGGHCVGISLGPLVLIHHVFRPLQVLSACTSALAHGGHCAGISLGPVVLIYHVFRPLQVLSPSPVTWLMGALLRHQLGASCSHPPCV
jgi:phosphate/sulfate permease